MAKKKVKKNRRHEDNTTRYILFVTAIIQFIRAVVDLIDNLTG